MTFSLLTFVTFGICDNQWLYGYQPVWIRDREIDSKRERERERRWERDAMLMRSSVDISGHSPTNYRLFATKISQQHWNNDVFLQLVGLHDIALLTPSASFGFISCQPFPVFVFDCCRHKADVINQLSGFAIFQHLSSPDREPLCRTSSMW